MRSRLPTVLLALGFFIPLLLGLAMALYFFFSIVYVFEEALFGLGLEYRRFPFGLNLAIILIALAAVLAAPLAAPLAWSLAKSIRRRADHTTP